MTASHIERLRLRGSRAGRTLTLVFEEGYERRGGRIFPFETLGAEAPSPEGAAGFEVPVDESALLAMRQGERRFVIQVHDLAGIGDQRFAGGGGDEPPAFAREQLRARLLLKFLELRADRRWTISRPFSEQCASVSAS